MAENAATVNAADIVAKAQYALDNGWGYIWGASGQIWTQASQDSATREMTVKYGQKWVGKHVVDCSGLFYWAFKQLGGYMYHGSNTMYKSYCTSKGKLSGGKRTDGQPLLPGTAIFTGTEDSHGHVGMYVGDGYVIEAKGTQAGVVKTPVTDPDTIPSKHNAGCPFGQPALGVSLLNLLALDLRPLGIIRRSVNLLVGANPHIISLLGLQFLDEFRGFTLRDLDCLGAAEVLLQAVLDLITGDACAALLPLHGQGLPARLQGGEFHLLRQDDKGTCRCSRIIPDTGKGNLRFADILVVAEGCRVVRSFDQG